MASILVVEDDAALAAVTVLILELWGHRVRVAPDGEAGLQALASGLPDLVVLDVEMPKLDGPSTAYRMFVLDAGQEQIPIVLVSGIADLRMVAERVGTPYFLEKPVDMDRLAATVDRALVERRPPTPSESHASLPRRMCD